MSFYDKVISLCKEKGVSRSRMADDIGISRATPKDWLVKGSNPQFSTIKKIADYFGVSVEYLTSEQPAVQDNQSIIGHDHTPVTNENESESNLTDEEIELLNVFGDLGVMDRAKLLVYANELHERKQQKTVSVYRAARSSENHEDGVLDVSKERIEKLRAAKDTEVI